MHEDERFSPVTLVYFIIIIDKMTVKTLRVASYEREPTLHVPPLKIEELEKREAPATMPQPPFLCGMFGSRGSGKTTAMINMLRMYDQIGAFDHIVIFSPTFEKDPKFEAWLDSGPQAKVDLVVNFDHSTFEEYLRKFDDRVREYLLHRKAIKAYEKYVKRGEKALTDDELLVLYQYDFTDPKAQNNFEKGVPSHCIVFDDQVGNRNVFRNDSAGPVGMFTLRHRHYLCSVFFLSQADNNGIPKQLRKNLNVCIFFANKSIKMKMDMAQEMNSHVSPDDFVAMWDFATQEDYAFFMCIFDAKNKEERFRKNFDTLILPGDGIEEGDSGVVVDGEQSSDSSQEHSAQDEPEPRQSSQKSLLRRGEKGDPNASDARQSVLPAQGRQLRAQGDKKQRRRSKLAPAKKEQKARRGTNTTTHNKDRRVRQASHSGNATGVRSGGGPDEPITTQRQQRFQLDPVTALGQ